MRILNKLSENTLRTLIITLTIYCVILIGIPLFKAIFTNPLTTDDLRKEVVDEGLIILDVLPGGVSDKAGLKTGDTILAVNNIRIASKENSIYNFNNYHTILSEIQPGTKAVYTIIRKGIPLNVEVQVYRYFHLIFFTFAALGLSFMFIGFLVGYSRPKELISQIFFLLGFTGGLGMISYMGTVHYYLIINVFYLINYNLGQILFFLLFLYFFTIYPTKYEFKYRKTLLLSFNILIFTLFEIGFFDGLGVLPRISLLLAIFYYLPASTVLLGIILFINSYRKIKEQKLRKSLRIVFWGFIIGGVGFVYFLLAFVYRIIPIDMNPLYRLPNIIILAIPFSFGFSIFKYRILDTEFIIKRGVVFGIITVFTVIAYLIIAFIIKSIFSGTDLIQSQFANVLIIILVVLTFDYVNNRAKKIADKFLYRERYNYRKSLLDFTKELPYLNNLTQIIERLDASVKDTMGITNINFWINDYEYLEIIEKNLNPEKGELLADREFRNKAYSMLYEYDAEPKILYEYNLRETELPEDLKNTIRKDKVVLSVPIFIKDKLIGAINFGEKLSGKAFSEEDIDLLKTLALQTAIAFENARLQIQEIQKKQIDEELNIAKKIQLGLLPKEIEKIKGLEICGSSMPAKYIGGDFFDLIKIDENRMLVIVADVSGKGIPAALYMSNVQAVLKFASNIFKSPRDILIEINKQILDKLDRQSFVTMIIALFDRNINKIFISRAGHNPLLYSANEKFEFLKGKGIGLGLEKNSIFESNLEEVELELKQDGIFFFYSDGLTEAMNTKREEYGTERIIEILSENRKEPCEEIVKKIESDVTKFRGGAEQNDDITFVIVKT
ncbi:MAG: PDZ domain-containing protein [Ignavibacteria bacterium]|nr:PDZ domain-containing protein [Ignavibacteria bacterium]